jgi:hypothetical protein
VRIVARVPNRIHNPPRHGIPGGLHTGSGNGLGGGGGKGGGGKPRPSRINRQAVIDRAVQSVQQAILTQNPTMSGSAAMHFAQVALTRPGVRLGPGGKIFYKPPGSSGPGQRFAPLAFAKSQLVQQATGALASQRNQAAIQGDPQYLQTVAQLAQARDQSLAGLDDQTRQSLIEYGDPTFAGSDAATAAAASQNPFSTASLQRQNYQSNLSQEQQQANRLGVSAGGGAISGRQGVQQQYAGQVQDAITKLQQLLGATAQERAMAGQTYTQGQSQAALDAYNALLASGSIHAAKPPSWAVGTYQIRKPRRSGGKQGGGGGGVGGTGLPPIAIGTGGKPVIGPPPPYGGGNPPVYSPTTGTLPDRSLPPSNPGLPGSRLPFPGPVTQQPLDMQATLRRYGIYT